MTSELYEPLIERDPEAFPPVARAFVAAHSPEELWLAVTRFAVLAYSPSQHAKRAVMACLAAHALRAPLGERWIETVIACAGYASESRQPWSEPPMLDPPESSSGDLEELHAARRDGDRSSAERWLAANLDEAPAILRELCHRDALLMLDTATSLIPLLGDKGRYALLRMPVWELIADPGPPDEETPLDALLGETVEAKGSPDAVTAVFWAIAASEPAPENEGGPSDARLAPYPLARDYAQTLIAHSFARRLSSERAALLLDAVHENLEHGESFADWSFA